MLLANRPKRSPFDWHFPPTDRSLQRPLLPFTMICRDTGYPDSCMAFHRYAYLEDCVHDVHQALHEIYADADEQPSYSNDCDIDVAHTVEVYAHGEHRLTLSAHGHDIDPSGPWSQVWRFLAEPFELRIPDPDRAHLPPAYPF